jgi:tetratricopeptide (TPR) repeat protein
MEYFNESEYLIPNDFQSQVSAGSAIHSLIYNGFNKNIIQPITSEPIILITTDNKTEIVDFVFEAGCQIPSELTVKNNLFPQFEGQKIIEIPVCIGNKNKILYNLKLYSPDENGFKKSEPIKLQAEINADKLLLIRAIVANKTVMVEPINPFANKDLTTSDRIKHLAEKEFRLACAKNSGEPTYQSLKNLYDAYEKIDLHFKAAETLEQISELFPKNANYNNIGLCYSKAGKKQKAMEFYEKAMEESPCATTAFNIAMQVKFTDSEKYQNYIQKAIEFDENHNPSLVNYAKILKQKGKKEEAEILLNKAFNNWERKFENNTLQNWDHSWFALCAEELGKLEFAEQIRESAPKKDDNKVYNSENLTKLNKKTI